MDVRKECPGLRDMLEGAKKHAARGGANSSKAAAAGGYAHAPAISHEPPEANGGTVGDRYRWTQTREVVDIHIYVPEATKGRDVVVKVSESTCDVRVSGISVFSGAWEFKVDPE